MVRSCLAEASHLGKIVHSKKGAHDVSSEIGILCIASSRTAEVLIAIDLLPPDFCSLIKSPARLSRATQDQLKLFRLITAADLVNRSVGVGYYLLDPLFGYPGRCWIPPNDF